MNTESQQPIAPVKDKREVILEFHSSPDAILNALHQAGWQIIPKAAQPQRSEQQEWTVKDLKDRIDALAKVKEKP